MTALVRRTLAEAGAGPDAVLALATAAAKAGEPGVVAAAAGLGVPLLVFGAAELAAVAVPGPSAVVRAAVGTPAVAEAAALLAAGPGGAELVVGKRKSVPRDGGSAMATCAVARRARGARHRTGPAGPAGPVVPG
ncbi:cobalamin biosynthesis protein [Streptomyces sp. NPDC018031]|uniref:cobalamin biosynthesis protein n=1 Tax=Streptomyces sp. NPDC018031 TaxID=3365033 RepID=UPI00379ED02B